VCNVPGVRPCSIELPRTNTNDHHSRRRGCRDRQHLPATDRLDHPRRLLFGPRARSHRHPHRLRLGIPRDEALGLGLAGRDQRQHHALFFVYLGALFGADERIPLFGQAGRQVFFIVTSIYGWWRWNESRKRRGVDNAAPAITPRWATTKERYAMVALWLLGTVLVHQIFVALWNAAPNPYWQPQWWFYWCDAWIFVGSIIATYAMARGWNEFWLAWIGVDLVGVPLGFATGYVPTAVMYIFYGLFVLYGFSQWVKASRASSSPDRVDDRVTV
jgi:nicotinamide mononucleotide transporter